MDFQFCGFYTYFDFRGDSFKDKLDGGLRYLVHFFLIEEQNIFCTIILT